MCLCAARPHYSVWALYPASRVPTQEPLSADDVMLWGGSDPSKGGEWEGVTGTGSSLNTPQKVGRSSRDAWYLGPEKGWDAWRFSAGGVRPAAAAL